MTPPNVIFVPSSGVDWDTYEGGVWKVPSLQLGSSGSVFTGTLVKTSTYPTTHLSGIEGWASSNNRPVSRFWNAGEPPPYVAVWNDTDGRWLGVAGFTNIGSNRAFYDTPDISVSDGAVEDLNASENETIYIIYLSQDPGDISGWRNYDGPTS